MDNQQQETKAEQTPAPVKKEVPIIVAETKVLDGAAPPASTGKKKNSAKKKNSESGKEPSVPHSQLDSFNSANICASS